MQSPSDNGSYLAVPLASWETKKRPLESQDAPDTVSSTPKRRLTPENTFSSGCAPMTDSHDGIISVNQAAAATFPLLGVNAESEQPCHAIPRMHTAEPNFVHQPGPMHGPMSNQNMQSSYVSQFATHHNGTWDQLQDTIWETFSETDDLLDVAYSPSRLFETTETFMDNEILAQGTSFPQMDNTTSNQSSDAPGSNAGDLTFTEPNMEIASYLGHMDTESKHATTESQREPDWGATAFQLGNITGQKALDSPCYSPDASGVVELETQLDSPASTPSRSVSSLEDPDALTPNNDEDPSRPNFNTCLGLVRHITQNSCPLKGC